MLEGVDRKVGPFEYVQPVNAELQG